LKSYLTKAKIGQKPPNDNIIEALNFYYEGPVDGHDLPELLKAFEKLRSIKGPKLLHVITKKGKGLKQAEEDQVKYHAPGKFDKTTGEVLPKNNEGLPPKFQDVFGLTLLELAEQDESIVGITPAMPTGSSLKYMMQALPDRAFDVGIAEQHAVTLAAGMATKGHKVFCAIYSTFLQRAYDQVIHDVALQNLPVIFCIDRAGLVGNDGATHHGVFDLAYLRCIPNLIIAAPADAIELRQLLYTATQNLKQPMAIRYPRGRGEILDWKADFKALDIGMGRCLQEGSELAVLSLGSIASHVSQSIKAIGGKFSIAHYDLRFLKPLDEELLESVFEKFPCLITIEDGTVKGGFGDAVLEFAQVKNYKGRIYKMGIPDQFIEHGDTEELYDISGISSEQIKEKIFSILT
jgi:1-deoxy-D-xylulose-5-phosphate synthase